MENLCVFRVWGLASRNTEMDAMYTGHEVINCLNGLGWDVKTEDGIVQMEEVP